MNNIVPNTLTEATEANVKTPKEKTKEVAKAVPKIQARNISGRNVLFNGKTIAPNEDVNISEEDFAKISKYFEIKNQAKDI